jgi:hypothetical protein
MCALTQVGAGNFVQLRWRGIGEPQSFIGKEEEGLVPAIVKVWNQQKADQRSAEVVLPQCLLRHWRNRVAIKPTVGIESIVAQIVKRRSVILIRAGRVMSSNCPPGVWPYSAEYVDVTARNSCSASMDTRLCVVPRAVSPGVAPAKPAPVKPEGETLASVLPLTPSTVK